MAAIRIENRKARIEFDSHREILFASTRPQYPQGYKATRLQNFVEEAVKCEELNVLRNVSPSMPPLSVDE